MEHYLSTKNLWETFYKKFQTKNCDNCFKETKKKEKDILSSTNIIYRFKF